MRQKLEQTSVPEGSKTRNTRRLLEAPALQEAKELASELSGMALQINTTMEASKIQQTLDAATAFFKILGEGEFQVRLTISRIEGEAHAVKA